MTPDEYRKKYKSCYTCKYYGYSEEFEIFDFAKRKSYKQEICKVRNCEINPRYAKKCECYNPTPFKERETNE